MSLTFFDKSQGMPRGDHGGLEVHREPRGFWVDRSVSWTATVEKLPYPPINIICISAPLVDLDFLLF